MWIHQKTYQRFFCDFHVDTPITYEWVFFLSHCSSYLTLLTLLFYLELPEQSWIAARVDNLDLFLIDLFIILRKVPSIPNLLRIFNHKLLWNLIECFFLYRDDCVLLHQTCFFYNNQSLIPYINSIWPLCILHFIDRFSMLKLLFVCGFCYYIFETG